MGKALGSECDENDVIVIAVALALVDCWHAVEDCFDSCGVPVIAVTDQAFVRCSELLEDGCVASR